jgi:hypothetical protein
VIFLLIISGQPDLDSGWGEACKYQLGRDRNWLEKRGFSGH